MKEYSIHGGDKGARRLDILSGSINANTKDFIVRSGIQEADLCLNLGCGSGRVSLMLAEIIGAHGHVLGLDMDERNIQLAKGSALTKGKANVAFKCFDVYHLEEKLKYNVIYSRFLLSHLKEPKKVLQKAFSALVPGGKLLIEDTDFSGHFSNPQSSHFDQYVSLYQTLLRKRGADADIGRNLFWLFRETGFTDIEFQISQPAHIWEDGKLMAEMTFEGISEALIEEGLITPELAFEIQSGLVQFRKREDTLMSLPRIFQIRAKRPKND